jgi:hypothetical protein
VQPSTYGQSEPVPPPPAAPTKKFNGKVVAGLVLVLVALIFAAMAMFGSWWSLKESASGVDATIDFGLNQYCVKGTIMGISASACQGYGTAYTGFTSLSKTQNLMGLAYILTLLGLVMAILTLILIIVGAGRPKLKMGVLICGIIGGIILLVAFIYVFTGLTGAINDDMTGGTATPISGFFGSTSLGGVDLSWGGALGWYMALLGFIMLLVGALIASSGMKKPVPAPPPM